ncbi:hypothetical protein NESM_000144700 [Novymonas esmeraldas]|uniref:Membrane-associated protein n=1 Tax=Novymonas esmeraldas TaxID=1808958 RepID=A0AAW0F608_9TRYP
MDSTPPPAAPLTRSVFELLTHRNGLAEVVLMYWWVIIVAILVLLSCAQHLVKCWEQRQDRLRLECCHLRSCQRRRAAQASKSAAADAPLLGLAAAEAATATATPVRSRGTTTLLSDAGTSAGSTPVAAAQTALTAVVAATVTTGVSKSAPLPATAQLASLKRKKRPSVLRLTRSLHNCVEESEEGTGAGDVVAVARQRRSANDLLGAAVVLYESDGRQASLMFPMTSTSSSDMSFSPSSLPTAPQSTASAATRLLNRFSFMSSDANQGNEDSFEGAYQSNSSASSSRLNNCCPRYSEDEQRSIDEKRQENVRAWMEAKRALESTESLVAGSCGATPMSSVTNRKGAASELDGVEAELVS